MATITMESEEYDEYLALKEKVKELEQQNTRLLLNADKSVTVINQTIITERMHLKKGVDAVLEAVDGLFNKYQNRYLDLDYDKKLNLIYNVFFTTSDSTTVVEQRVEEKGLDEHIQNMKDQLLKEISEETKKKLDSIPILEKEVQDLRENNNFFYEQNKNIGNYKREIDSLKEYNNRLEKDINKLKSTWNEISTILENDKWNIFNYNKKKQKIRTIYWYGTTQL